MKYIISNEIATEGCRFAIIPPNNRNQTLGVSPYYKTVEDCEKAKREFAFLVLKEELNKLDDKFIKIESYKDYIIDENGKKRYSTKYKFLYLNQNGEIIFYRANPFEERRNCIKCLDSIYNAVLENYNLI